MIMVCQRLAGELTSYGDTTFQTFWLNYEYITCVFPLSQATENEPGDMDLSGLPETAVDSEEDDDEEDIERSSDPLMSRDIVRDCLEKDPMDRTDDDIGEHPCSIAIL